MSNDLVTKFSSNNRVPLLMFDFSRIFSNKKVGIIMAVDCFSFYGIWLGGERNYIPSVPVAIFKSLSVGLFSSVS